MRRNMRWEAPWIPTGAYDSCLLPEQEMPLVTGMTWCLGSRDSQVVSSESKTFRKYRKRSGRRSDYYWHVWTKDEEEQWGWNFLKK